MKHVGKLSVKLIIAIPIGLLLAGASTKITYTCVPIDGAVGCVSLEKAVMHPNDLINNKQDSLVHFSEAFAISSLASFAILSIFSSFQKKKI